MFIKLKQKAYLEKTTKQIGYDCIFHVDVNYVINSKGEGTGKLEIKTG